MNEIPTERHAEDEFTGHECGKCGEMLDLIDVHFGPQVRTLCPTCVNEILGEI
jgi:hypothetical protein